MVASSIDSETTFSRSELLILGLVFEILCCACVVIYSVVLWIFATHQAIKKLMSYRIMVHLGVLDILQILAYNIMGTMMMANSNFGYGFSKFSGCFATSVWCGVVFVVLVLALNRFEILIKWDKNNVSDKACYIGIFVAYFISLANFLIQLLPDMGTLLEITTYVYEPGLHETHIDEIQTIGGLALLVMATIIYLTTVVGMIVKRLWYTDNKQLMSSHERRIFFMSMIICSYKTLISTLFTYYTPPTKAMFVVYWTSALMESGHNPFLYLIMNARLRKEFLRLVSKPFRKASLTSSIVTPINVIRMNL